MTTTLHPPTKQIRLTAEQQIRGCGLDWTILRPTMIYGAASDRDLSRLLLRLRRAAVLPVPGTGTCLHQPVHVADVAAAVLAALERPAAIGSLYDVAGLSGSRSPNCCGPAPARSEAGPGWCPYRSRRW